MMDWRSAVCVEGVCLAVLGDPVEHSLSPKMQAAAMREMGISGRYHAYKVREEEFEECVAHLASAGFTGVNVTIPHKEAASSIAGGDSIVKELGVANTLKFSDNRILATNTDVQGFWAPLSKSELHRALVLGAGGAAVATVFALRAKGIEVRVWNRSPERAKELALRFRCDAANEPDPIDCDLVVNTTPLGLKPGDIPNLIWQNLAQNCIVYDVAYRGEPTDLVLRACEAGCRTIDGREMLVEQGALALEWWVGRSVPREPMRRAVGL